jgi:hypothetical protein
MENLDGLFVDRDGDLINDFMTPLDFSRLALPKKFSPHDVAYWQNLVVEVYAFHPKVHAISYDTSHVRNLFMYSPDTLSDESQYTLRDLKDEFAQESYHLN